MGDARRRRAGSADDALGTTSILWILTGAALLAGVGVSIFEIGWHLALQEHVPERLLAHVYSYDILGSFAAIPLGQLAFVPLGAALGLQATPLAAGICSLGLALLVLLVRSVRDLPRRPAGADAV